MEFFLSASFASVRLDDARFADKAALWNVPRASVVRPPLRLAAPSREDKPEFTNPWGAAPDLDVDTGEKGGYVIYGGYGGYGGFSG